MITWQPLCLHLREDWSVSKDGLTYTYKIRKGNKWYWCRWWRTWRSDCQRLRDWSEMTPLIKIGNSSTRSRFLSKDWMIMSMKTHFSRWCQSVDDCTISILLNKPETLSGTETTNGIFVPISTEFSKSRRRFGQLNDVKSQTDHLWNPLLQNHLLYLKKNDNYWDKKNVHLERSKYTYYDGSDQDSLARDSLMVLIQSSPFLQVQTLQLQRT